MKRLLVAIAVLASTAIAQSKIENRDISVEFDSAMHSRIIAFGSTAVGPMSASETVVVDGKRIEDFEVTSRREESVQDKVGSGKRLKIEGKAGTLSKIVSATAYFDFPNVIVFEVTYTNRGSSPIVLSKWTNNSYKVAGDAFWSFQPGTYEKRPSWVVPLRTGFTQKNYLGMNASDYGGGTPFADIWTRQIGVAVGDLAPVPNAISLPVAMPLNKVATLAVEFEKPRTMAPGEALTTLPTYALVHRGDFYNALKTYGALMRRMSQPEPESAPNAGRRPMWCAWGYGRRFKVEQIEKTIPEAMRLGFEWVTVDDGWQTQYGDLTLDPKKFPHGDADMKSLVDGIHRHGLKAQLWWSPMSAAPNSELLKQQPELVLRDQKGTPRKISWWNSFYLCPANAAVLDVQRRFVDKIIGEWGFDGLKLDGQYMNAAPACYNGSHHHARPEESTEQLPLVFKAIYEEAQKIKPGSLVEFCPCGTSYSFYTMPYYNMSVASDPTSSWQVRSKAKALKAMLGDGVPYFGDHVELSDHATDFASTIGVGGVVGSQFTLPAVASRATQFDLTPARRKLFQKWVALYKSKMLSEGEYQGSLYDIGFDRPEAHAIKKQGSMYYAFFAPQFSGEVELRGLENRTYKVVDYEKNAVLGTVHGPTARLKTSFTNHLLLETNPQ